MKKRMKVLPLILSIIFLLAVFVSCASENEDNERIADVLIGTWYLYEGNIEGLSESMNFYADGTGSSVLGDSAGTFEWSINADGNLSVLTEGVPENPDDFPPDYDFTMEIVYKILELTETRVSMETTVYGLGYVWAVYVR